MMIPRVLAVPKIGYTKKQPNYRFQIPGFNLAINDPSYQWALPYSR